MRSLRLFLLLAFAIAHAPSGFAQSSVLIPSGSVWKYLDDGSNQGTAWRGTAFDDASWNSGPAQLGYGNNDEATVVSYGANGSAKFATTYFRRTFNVANPGAFGSVVLSVTYDDAAAVYINGTEAARTANLAANAAFNTYATSTSSNNAVQSWTLPPSVLQAGLNTIAVEIHQANGTSSDISFDLQLLAGGTVTRGPYLQKAASDAVTVRWRTIAATDSRVRYGTSAANLTQFADDSAVTTEHEVRLTGLAPDTKYFYSVGTTTAENAGGLDFTFTTPPLPGTAKPTRIWVLGDSGTANSAAAAVRDAYVAFTGAQHTDVWLMLGDNAYPNGTDAQFQAAVFDMYPAQLRRMFLWPTIGNHDTASSSSFSWTGPYLDKFSLPSAGEGGGLPSGSEKYYSFDYADVHFICLDSMTSDRNAGGPMATWLTNDLAATTRKWIIAYFHHPPYTKGSHDSDAESQLIDVRQKFLPILEAGGVDLVLTGHSHSYERSMLIDGHYGLSGTLTAAMKVDDGDGSDTGDGAYGKDPAPRAGAVYAVCGSSGQIGGGTLNHPVMVASLNVLGSMVIDVNGQRLDARFIDGTGVVRDQFTMLKSPLVTVSVTPAAVSEDSTQPAVVTLSRTREIGSALPVNITLSGGATPGADYQNFPLPVTIAAGSASASFSITPVRDEIAEGTESIVATAQGGPNHRVHRNSRTANVSIQDSANGIWRTQRFGANANNPAISGDDRDPDGDGIPNLHERAFGLDPLLPSQGGMPQQIAGPYLTLSFQRPAGVDDLRYTVQVAPLLDPGAWNDGSSYRGASILSSNAHTTEVSRTGTNPETIIVGDNTPPGAGTARFMRLKVTRD